MAGFFEDGKLRIKLSNTESVRSNIFKYTNLKKEGEIRPSSTAGYFLSTNLDQIAQMKSYLNCDFDEFVVNVLKTQEYIGQMNQIVELFNLNDFHDNLRDYFDNASFYSMTNENFSIGKPECTVDDGNRLNIKFENLDENVKRFRGIVIAIFCDLVIEKNGNKNMIYPVLKEDIANTIRQDYLNNTNGEVDNMKEKFRKWLVVNVPTETSADLYISQIEIMSRESIDDGIITKELFTIKDIAELEEVAERIKSSDKFIARVASSNHINNAALNHYLNFIKVYYDESKFLEEVFIDDINEYNKLKKLVLRKKNIILKGSPGVGKTFMAKRLAYSIIGTKAKNQILSVQFHQSFSYEDFVEGIRPKKGEEDKFIITPGMFRDFVEEALKNPKKEYFVIIDEINRGNLSKILGELMKLIEADKRYDFVSKDYEYVILPYSREEFKIPNNIYIIGTMNTADRSLTMVDYALRRRFAFYHVDPKFNTKSFFDWLMEKNGIKERDINEIITRMNRVNASIDTDLNNGFEIGHSYFVDTLDKDNFKNSYDNIIEYEIKPLIEEYFIDEKSKIEEYNSML